MKNMRNKEFLDCLDTIWMINKPAREGLGEDSFYCGQKGNSAIVTVCDGCGGLGARKYETFKGHTGAYIASRTVSGAIHDWYNKNYLNAWNDINEMALNINDYIHKAYDISSSYGVERLRIAGSMVRKFPTTFATAYAQEDAKGRIEIAALWAGDSRVYRLDEDGLAQLTRDDTDVEDALENLMSDGAMTNVLSSDGKYKINYKTLYVTKPTMIFAATDGCFGYIPSPMEFEYEFLNALMNSDTPKAFRENLRSHLAEYAGDDLALGLMSFFYGDFKNTKKSFAKRFEYLKKEYISILEKEQNDECTQRLWKQYKSPYERDLKDS